MNPIAAAKGKVVKVVVKRVSKEALKRIDTPEERNDLVKSIKIEGISPTLSWAVSVIAGLTLEAVSATGFDALISGDPAAWGRAVLHVFGAKLLLFIQSERDAVVEDKGEAK